MTAPAAMSGDPAVRQPVRQRPPFLAAGWAGRAARAAAVGAVLFLAVAFDLPLCPVAIVSHHPCPGCGLTRATLAMLHGDLHAALHFHPLAPLVAPLVLVMLAVNVLGYVRAGKSAAVEGLRGRLITGFGLLLAVAMVAVWVARFFGAFGGPVPV